MDMQDRELDTWICTTLQSDTILSTRRKNHAWEQICRQAAHQPILAVMPEEEKVTAWQRLAVLSRVLRGWAAILTTEESHFERARERHYMIRYGGPSRDGRLVLQFVNPIGFGLMSAAI
jgi:hypothetical protein